MRPVDLPAQNRNGYAQLKLSAFCCVNNIDAVDGFGHNGLTVEERNTANAETEMSISIDNMVIYFGLRRVGHISRDIIDVYADVVCEEDVTYTAHVEAVIDGTPYAERASMTFDSMDGAAEWASEAYRAAYRAAATAYNADMAEWRRSRRAA